jgi:hypothetical protein
MKKWIILLIMVIVTINIVNAGFFVSTEGQSSSNNGLFAFIRSLFTSPDCIPNWQDIPSECAINDSQLKIYQDTNNCGTGVGLPGDNGTFTGFCNYCSWELNIIPTTVCQGSNETYNATVFDQNWINCCNITGLDSDCYQDDTQNFNKTYYEVLQCEEEINMWELALIIIPLLLGFLFIVGSAVLGEDHTILKIFLFILALITPIISFQYAITIINYFEPALGSLISDIGTHVIIISWVFVVILIYFVLYSTVKLLEYLARKKQDKLRY